MQQVGRYQVQAAISALHAEAKAWEATDWPQIYALYRLLYDLYPSAVVRINQSIAMSYAISIDEAIGVLEQVKVSSEVEHYQPWYTAMADLLERKGNNLEARPFLLQAIKLTENVAEKRFLADKLQRLCHNY